MRRRQFLTSASATLAAASIAGCSGVLGGGGGGGGSSGPDGAVRSYIEAGLDGDQEGLNQSIHPDASQNVRMSASMMQMAEDVTIQNVEVVSQSENEATVEATVQATLDGETRTGSSTYVVQKFEGEWRVYAIQN